MWRLIFIAALASVRAQAAEWEDLIEGNTAEDSLLRAGRTFAFVRALEADIAREPANGQWHASLALGYFLLGQRRFCHEEIERALAINAGSPGTNYVAGRIAMDLDADYRRAIAYFRVVLLSANDSFKTRYFLGVCLKNLGRRAEALDQFRAASVNATYDWPFTALAEEEIGAGNFRNALAAALKASSMNDSAENLVLAGKAWQALADSVKAQEFFERAAKRDPDWETPHYLLGRLFATVPGKTAEARTEMARFKALRDAGQ